MSAAEIVEQLKAMGKESTKKVLLNHGIPEPLFGVKVEDMKKIQKKVKKDYQLALDLYDTGIYDAMYLAGLIADDKKMTKKDLQHWVERIKAPATAQYTVAWVAAESNHGWEMAREWIESDNDMIAVAGWATLCSLVGIKDDSELKIPEIKKLLQRVQKTIHHQPNGVRYAMNMFVICVGSYVQDLTGAAIAVAQKIGKVTVDMGDTSCKVPDAVAYIEKVSARGSIGKKRKTAKC